MILSDERICQECGVMPCSKSDIYRENCGEFRRHKIVAQAQYEEDRKKLQQHDEKIREALFNNRVIMQELHWCSDATLDCSTCNVESCGLSQLIQYFKNKGIDINWKWKHFYKLVKPSSNNLGKGEG